jgi:hypothetical protein
VQSANGGRSAVMDGSPVANASGAGLRSHVTMTNIDRGSFLPESVQIQFAVAGWLLTT